MVQEFNDAPFSIGFPANSFHALLSSIMYIHLDSRWIADELYQDAGIDLMIDNLFIMLYFATSLSILVPRSHRPDRLIAFDFKRIIFTLSVEWSN